MLWSTTMASMCSALPWPTLLSMFCLSQSALSPIPRDLLCLYYLEEYL